MFFASLIPFATAWASNTGFAAVPVSLNGGVLFLTAIAYQTLDMTIRHAKGQMDSLWTVATGDRRNLLTVTSYAVTVPLAYIYVPAVYLIYVLTAFLWIFPEVEGHAS